MRPHLSKQTARRIDRGAFAAHRFHRWAHHPVCERYANEVIALGRYRVCRGCSYLALGAAAGAVVAALEGFSAHVLDGRAQLISIALGVALFAFAFALRLPKFLSRAAPGFLLVAPALSSPLGAALSVTIVTAGFVAYRRRGPNRSICAACPERASQPCSGLKPLIRRERAFVRWSRPHLISPL